MEWSWLSSFDFQLLNFEDKRLKISLLTLKISPLLMNILKTASCAGSPGCPTWFNTCYKIIVIDVKSCPFITQGKIITMPRFWFAFQMSLTYHMRAGGWRWMKCKMIFEVRPHSVHCTVCATSASHSTTVRNSGFWIHKAVIYLQRKHNWWLLRLSSVHHLMFTVTW